VAGRLAFAARTGHLAYPRPAWPAVHRAPRDNVRQQDDGRPRRRYYKLAEDSAERARIALAQATTSLAALGLWPRPATGLA
jgi:hypothetical protein